jgi:hypothetical protein
MTGPRTPPPTPTQFQAARARAQLRRPPGPNPRGQVTPPQPRPSLVALLRPRLRAGVARARGTIRRWLAPKRRGRTALALTLLTLTPLLGPAPRAIALAGGALYLARLERRFSRRRAPHRFRWARGEAPSLRRMALAEIASRWYGRAVTGAPYRGAQLLARGVVLIGWALGQWADAGALALLAWAAPTAAVGHLSLGAHPFPLLGGGGWGEPTPTQELLLIGGLGLGLWAGAGAGAGLGAPLASLVRLALQGVRWGLLLRALVPLKQALICSALGAGGASAGIAALLALAALALAAGLRDLAKLRYSPLRALLEAPAQPSRGGGALPTLSGALLSTVVVLALALALGLGVGLFCPGPDALAGGLTVAWPTFGAAGV